MSAAFGAAHVTALSATVAASAIASAAWVPSRATERCASAAAAASGFAAASGTAITTAANAPVASTLRATATVVATATTTSARLAYAILSSRSSWRYAPTAATAPFAASASALASIATGAATSIAAVCPPHLFNAHHCGIRGQLEPLEPRCRDGAGCTQHCLTNVGCRRFSGGGGDCARDFSVGHTHARLC